MWFELLIWLYLLIIWYWYGGIKLHAATGEIKVDGYGEIRVNLYWYDGIGLCAAIGHEIRVDWYGEMRVNYDINLDYMVGSGCALQ